MAEQHRTRARSSSAATRPRTPTVRGAGAAARSACEELGDLIGHPAEGASAVRRTDDGWCVAVDILEVPRIPDTTSLLATYEVMLDENGDLVEYRRVRRYRRGAADE